MIRKLVFGVVVLAVLAGGGLAYLATHLNRAAARGTEEVLSYVLGVEVSVGEMDVAPRSGRIQIDELTVANPEGYETRHAFRFGSAVVEADLASFRTDTPTIRLIELQTPKITYEKELGQNSNLAQLIENASRFKHPGAEPDIDEEETPDEAPEGTAKRIRIERVMVNGSEVALSTPMLRGNELLIPLPGMEMEDLEGTPDELSRQFLIQIARQVVRSGGSKLPSDFENPLEAAGIEGRVRQGIDALKSESERLRGLWGRGDEQAEPSGNDAQ